MASNLTATLQFYFSLLHSSFKLWIMKENSHVVNLDVFKLRIVLSHVCYATLDRYLWVFSFFLIFSFGHVHVHIGPFVGHLVDLQLCSRVCAHVWYGYTWLVLGDDFGKEKRGVVIAVALSFFVWMITCVIYLKFVYCMGVCNAICALPIETICFINHFTKHRFFIIRIATTT